MKIWTTVAAIAALSLADVLEASAQIVVSRTGALAPVVGAPVSDASTSVWPYSYYVAWPWLARGYIPYGPGDQFPFYGHAYGHPYDPWTWPYLSGGYSRYLARYYYPPVP